ncbi:MAG: class I SAM-dependent DNA methyltransferase [Armatimonadota bacterium]
MSDIVRRRFDAAAQTWDQNQQRKLLAEAVLAGILKRVPVNPQTDVMDYGCGTGMLTLELAPKVRSVLAADISDGMLSVLREKIKANNISNIKTILLDLQTDELVEQKFNLIVSNMTMHHVREVPRVIAKLAAALLPRGWLCVADLESEPGNFHADKTGVEHFGFAPSTVKQMFEQAGLQNITVETVFVMRRDVGGETRKFPIFLASGCSIPNHLLQ